MNTTRAVNNIVTHIGDLPAIPAVVSEVLQMTDTPNTTIAEMSEKIQQDPALTAKILRISNSPYYGMRQYVGTLKLALVILGVREIRNIAVGIAVLDTLRNEKTEMLLADDFWNHSLTTAAIARKLDIMMQLNHQGEAFIGGLLHDVGKMVLLNHYGDEYGSIYKDTSDAPERIVDIEKEKFGFTHADAGTALVERWNLPKALCEAVYAHHAQDDRPLNDAGAAPLVAVVRLANFAARHDFENSDETRWGRRDDAEAWNQLESATVPIPPDQRYKALERCWREVRDMPRLEL